MENIHVSTIYCSLLFTTLIFQQNCFLADIFKRKTKRNRAFVPPSPSTLFILFLPYVCNVELILKLFWLCSWMQSNKNSLLRCTLLQVVNMSLSTKLTFQSTHTVQPTYVAPNARPGSQHLVPWDWHFYMDTGDNNYRNYSLYTNRTLATREPG